MSYKRISPIPVIEGGTGASASLTGILTGNGSSAMTASTVTQYGTVVAGASNAVTSVAPSATSGVPLISQGAAANPAFGTAVVAGGGTGVTSTTAYAVLCGGTTSTGALQSVSGVGTSGQVLTSNGAAALPTWQAAAGGGVTTIAGTSGTATGATITITGADANEVTTSASGSTLSISLPNIYIDTDDVYMGIGAGNGNPGFNVFVGPSVGNSCSAGQGNTAMGYQAFDVGNGSNNTCIGNSVGGALTSGSQNTGIGQGSLQTTTTGSRNIAIGSVITGSDYPGKSWGTGDSDNICIANKGVSGDSGVQRYGTATIHTKTFISGIRGVTTANADAVAVLVDSAGQLGTVSSSIRYKMNVAAMGDDSDRLHDLRPVSFEYKQQPGKKVYGLIAEEVEKVLPELVAYGQDGAPESVKYHDLPAMLLNEIKKLKKQVDFLMNQILEKDR